jgi:hypothetical protein
MRKARILGLALVAMFSMGAVGAVSASADTLTSSGAASVLTGTEEEGFTDELKVTVGVAKCPDTRYQATIIGNISTAELVSVTPTYANCTAFGFPGTIDHGKCRYQFRVLAGTAGTVNLVCDNVGEEVTITAISAATPKCTVHIKPKSDIPGTIKYVNIAGGITVEVSLNSIHYTHTPGTGVGACTSGTANTGTVIAKATISAETHVGSPLSLSLN